MFYDSEEYLKAEAPEKHFQKYFSRETMRLPGLMYKYKCHRCGSLALDLAKS